MKRIDMTSYTIISRVQPLRELEVGNTSTSHFQSSALYLYETLTSILFKEPLIGTSFHHESTHDTTLPSLSTYAPLGGHPYVVIVLEP